MARIPILDENDHATPLPARQALQTAGQARGRVLNVYRALANRPHLVFGVGRMVQCETVLPTLT